MPTPSSALQQAAVGIVQSEDGAAFQLSVASASSEGDRQVRLLPERFSSEEEAIQAAGRYYPDLPITDEPLT